MRHVLSLTLLVAAVFALAASPALTLDEIRTERVKFKQGTSGATVKGTITGYEGVDYVLEAAKGQTMNVSMATDNASNYFNILPPGSNDVAIFIGSTQGTQFEGVLPESGDYKIRVYMMRNAARRKEVANYRLEMIVSGPAQKPASAPSKRMPSKDEQACLQAVSIETNNGDVVLLGTESSEANTVVRIGVGPQRAPWRCVVSDGTVAEVMSLTDEGRL